MPYTGIPTDSFTKLPVMQRQKDLTNIVVYRGYRTTVVCPLKVLAIADLMQLMRLLEFNL